MNTDFYRIKRLPPYIFEEVNRLKAQSRARGEDIIDFGMGNPDSAPPQHVMDKLSELVHNPKLYGYSTVGGVDVLKKSLAISTDKHDALRTFFREIDGKPSQIILPFVDTELEFSDLTDFSGKDQDLAKESFLRKICHSPFNIKNLPLFRYGLVQLKEKEYLLDDN